MLVVCAIQTKWRRKGPHHRLDFIVRRRLTSYYRRVTASSVVDGVVPGLRRRRRTRHLLRLSVVRSSVRHVELRSLTAPRSSDTCEFTPDIVPISVQSAGGLSPSPATSRDTSAPNTRLTVSLEAQLQRSDNLKTAAKMPGVEFSLLSIW